MAPKLRTPVDTADIGLSRAFLFLELRIEANNTRARPAFVEKDDGAIRDSPGGVLRVNAVTGPVKKIVAHMWLLT